MHDAPKSTCGPYLFELLKKKVSRFIFGCDFKKIFILILIFFFFFYCHYIGSGFGTVL
jgi:hypothetical protein